MRNSNFIKYLGLKIRTIRISKGYSQQHLANLCDVELSNINRIELGKINTSVAHAKLIADALDVHIKELFDFNELEDDRSLG
ncbi:MAG: helix-turn-helix transcriptional regulator [Saprospiraceae bacterium]|jgi:transcriptional regulator with XRE-family HTH domain|nr:helix-turn-helix transcriptional regulator [Saprospiraceae bacterium]MBK9565476.1 helix-turn-helix transcriptional regulator [Saprospiraceae bacterium]